MAQSGTKEAQTIALLLVVYVVLGGSSFTEVIFGTVQKRTNKLQCALVVYKIDYERTKSLRCFHIASNADKPKIEHRETGVNVLLKSYSIESLYINNGCY